MEEEADLFFQEHVSNEYCNCKCVNDDTISESFTENIDVPDRKEFILSIVSRTENYLRERRIPELIRFLFTKVIAQSPNNPVAFLEKLLDDCMLFRAGHGLPPVLYEHRHLEATIKSFDPGQRGWLSAGQVRRLYETLGLNYTEIANERVPCEIILENVKKDQEINLALILASGTAIDTKNDFLKNENVKSNISN